MKRKRESGASADDALARKRSLDYGVVRINLLMGRSAVSSLTEMTYLGLAHSAAAVARHAADLAKAADATEAQRSQFQIHKLLNLVSSDSAKAAADAAAIIYAHAILDAAVLKLCKLCAGIDPDAWLPTWAIAKWPWATF